MTERNTARDGPPPREAAQVRGMSAFNCYAQEHRNDVNEEILSSEPTLRSRIQNDDNESDQCEAEDELWDKSYRIMRDRFNALDASSKQQYAEREREEQHRAWSRLRSQGRLIENEESLAQKQQEDALIAMGVTPPSQQLRGRGGPPPPHLISQLQAELLKKLKSAEVKRNLCPPFDADGGNNVTLMKAKIGKIQSEE